jgi:hypothetical protein
MLASARNGLVSYLSVFGNVLLPCQFAAYVLACSPAPPALGRLLVGLQELGARGGAAAPQASCLS